MVICIVKHFSLVNEAEIVVTEVIFKKSKFRKNSEHLYRDQNIDLQRTRTCISLTDNEAGSDWYCNSHQFQ